MKVLLPIALIAAALYFLFSLINWFRAKKTNDPKQKIWLVRALVALLAGLGATMGLYQIKQKEKKNGTA